MTIWHFPFWTLQPSFAQYGWGYFGLNWLWIVAVTIFLTWLMNNTRNSVLLAVLFHWSVNMVNVGYLPVTGAVQPYGILIVLCWAVAIGLLVVFGPERLARNIPLDFPEVVASTP